MMLFYKAWRESRVRFALGAVGFALFCVWFVFTSLRDFPPPRIPLLPYTAFVWGTFYGNRAPVVFSFFALLLGLGGLQRERAGGTVGFTLALPVGRLRLLAVRAIVGLLEMTIVALVPAATIPWLSPMIVHHAYPVLQSLTFACLFLSWGVVWFGIGLTWSVIFSGEYTAVVASLLTPVVYMIVFARDGSRIALMNPFVFMSGFEHLAGRTSTFVGPLPWFEIGVLASIAFALFASAAALTARQSF
jgi:hypothetical protein